MWPKIRRHFPAENKINDGKGMIEVLHTINLAVGMPLGFFSSVTSFFRLKSSAIDEPMLPWADSDDILSYFIFPRRSMTNRDKIDVVCCTV